VVRSGSAVDGERARARKEVSAVNSWQRWAGLFFLGVAAVVLYQSLAVLHVREGGQPGSGFAPFALGLLLAALSLALVVTSRRPDAERVPFWEGRSWFRPLVAVAMTVVFIVVFDEVGAITSVAILVAGWLRFVGKKSVPVAVVTGVLTAAVVYAVFVRLLQTPFPRGLLV
jgi:hypothetical protein